MNGARSKQGSKSNKQPIAFTATGTTFSPIIHSRTNTSSSSSIVYYIMVRAAHLLIKHTGSRNPVSRRTGQQVTLAPELALAELRDYEARLQRGELTFVQAATERSDCSSYRNGGDLGDFERGQMQKPFEDASFALEPGAVSGIVSTDSGYHLIYRIS